MATTVTARRRRRPLSEPPALGTRWHKSFLSSQLAKTFNTLLHENLYKLSCDEQQHLNVKLVPALENVARNVSPTVVPARNGGPNISSITPGFSNPGTNGVRHDRHWHRSAPGPVPIH
jgi:hypothetical protein